MEEFIKSLNIKYEGFYNDDKDSYIIDLPDSDTFGNIYIMLENNNHLDLLDDNQLVTDQGSSLIYQDRDKKFLVNLLADWESDKYQVIINGIGE